MLISKESKKKYKIAYDETTGLWYAYEEGKHLPMNWRNAVINLGYPKKDAYQKARDMGLI